MTQKVMQRSGGSQPVGVWVRPDSSFDPDFLVGKKPESCCCNHPECVSFHGESWCRRLFAIRIGTDGDEGRPEDVSAVETFVKTALATRSYEDFCFTIMDDLGFSPERVLLVLLREREPPLCAEEIVYWSKYAAKDGAEQEPGGGACYVKVVRGTCCLFRAQEALTRILHLYSRHSEGELGVPEVSLAHELLGEVRAALCRSYGETDEEEEGG